MSGKARHWLPLEAVERNAVRAAAEACVAEWSAHWFARGELVLSGWALVAPGAAPDPGARDAGRGLQVACPTRAALRIACQALDVRLEQLDANGRDRALAAALARRIVDDLVARMGGLLSPEGDGGGAGRRLIATISDRNDPLVSVGLPAERLVALCRRTLPPPGPRPQSPAPRHEALGRTRLRLEVNLGEAAVSLAEARGLAVGDVILLDRRLDEAVDLTAARSPALVARGVLADAEGQVALILQSPT